MQIFTSLLVYVYEFPTPLTHSDPMTGYISLMDVSDFFKLYPYEPLRPKMTLCGILPGSWPMFIKSLPPLAHSDPMLCMIYLMGDMTFQTLTPMNPSGPI